MFDQARIIRIVIASPGDLEPERRAIPNLFIRWNRANRDFHLEPAMWETGSVPTYGDHPQHIINEQIVDSGDLLVALFWAKIGSPTPSGRSGTIEEIREFIRLKGPRRVMVYFCTRQVAQSPGEIDPTAIALLQEFKLEISSKCLFGEFKDTSEFEMLLYHHLDLKTDELVRGLLPIPKDPAIAETLDIWWQAEAADERLRQPIDFGSSIGEIALRFAKRMDEFDLERGATNNKFLNLGEHVYRSAARSIGLALQSQPYGIDVRIRPELNSVVTELIRLADDSSLYLKRPFPEFWNRGRVISDNLSTLAERYSTDKHATPR